MSEIPKKFLCPITLTIMKDPVIMTDGQTYERTAIYKALNTSPLSPLTKKPLSMKEALPNYSLKNMIEKYLNTGINPLKLNFSQNIDLNIQSKIKSFKAEVIDDPNNKKNVFINISLEPEKIDSRRHLILISMIDLSGSMSECSSQELKDGEEYGISWLSLVKHALNAIVLALNKDDKMALITFDDSEKISLEATNINDIGKEIILEEIKKMSLNGWTNIWDALRLGIIEAQKI